MSYAYQGYGRKARSSKRSGVRSKLEAAGRAFGSDAADTANPGNKQDTAFSAAMGKVIKGLTLGPFASVADKISAANRGSNSGYGGGYGAGSGDSPGAVAGHDSSDNDSAGMGGSDPGADV